MEVITMIYERIREENMKKYGTDIDKYGPVLLANLYSDKTHFIYELLQNAEDACERARKEGKIRDSFVSIHLFPEFLEIRHNGIEFDERDVKGICGLVEGTKSEDFSQIGRFGIGFKSVYAYTKSPGVYSGDKSFCIKNYVQPYAIKKRGDLHHEETLFVIPFNHDKISSENAFSEIKGRLEDLGLRTLLFLRNIKDISWKVDSSFGKYSRKTSKKVSSDIRYVYLLYEEKGIPKKGEEWLIFEKVVTINGRKVTVEVAYLLSKDKDNKRHVVPAKDTELVVFFPTQKETHLKFLIQGPYHTTPARDNIPGDDELNKKLIHETSLLVTESISKIKEMRLLDVSFLNTLPLQKEDFQKMMFRPIFDAVKEKLSGNDALLPSDEGEYVPARNALLSKREELMNLLSSEQLGLLFDKEGAKWLDRNITRDKTPDLRNYLIQEIGVLEIDSEKFAKRVTNGFIEQQNDRWMTEFYGFLLDKKALWRKGSHNRSEGPLRSKKIIRLEDNEHTAPFDAAEKPLVYLPSKSGKYFPTVKKNITNDQKAMEFLKNLGLGEIDRIAGLMDIILPKYLKKKTKINKEDNIRHVKWIVETLTSFQSDRRRKDLLEKLKETPFLQAKNMVNSQKAYRNSTEIYLGGVYTENNALETYFEGNDTVWFLDEQYTFVDVSVLGELGCEAKVRMNFRESSHDGNVTIIDERGHHERGIDRFDPNCEIDGLVHALRNLNVEKAVIIWDILKEHYKQIYGIVETSTRKDYTKSEKAEKYSKMGELLTNSSWLPDRNGNFCRPSELLLSDLSDELDKDSLEARYIAEKLKFKKDVEQELLEQLPDERKVLYEIVRDVPEKMIKKIKEMAEEGDMKKHVYPSDIHGNYQNALVSEGTSTTDNTRIEKWKSIHPDDEKRIRTEYGSKLLKRLQNPQVRMRKIITISQKFVDENSIDPKEFLYEQYMGRCQICSTILDLGSNKRPYFEIYRLFETRDENWWTDNEFNVLCLCPNCHALMKHGGRDLRNILKTAEKVLSNEIAPEEVGERSGDFYVVKIVVAGREKELFYSQRHMGTLAAFIETTQK